jgi:hypothetical protein
LHCLIYGDFIPIRHLKRQWFTITGGSDIVDIRPINDPQGASSDVARYASSPGSLVGLDLADACELVDAMHGKRACGTWGTGRVVSLRPPRCTDKSKWQNIGSWQAVVLQKNTNPNADAIWNSWVQRLVLPVGIDCLLADDFVDGLLRINPNDYDLDNFYNHERSPP